MSNITLLEVIKNDISVKEINNNKKCDLIQNSMEENNTYDRP